MPAFSLEEMVEQWNGWTINKTARTGITILIRAQRDLISVRRKNTVRWSLSPDMRACMIALELLIQLWIAFLVWSLPFGLIMRFSGGIVFSVGDQRRGAWRRYCFKRTEDKGSEEPIHQKQVTNGKGKLNLPDREERLMNDRLALASSHFCVPVKWNPATGQ